MSKIFISPLSWGLGHATRDIPIIRELIDRGHEVMIATNLGTFQVSHKIAKSQICRVCWRGGYNRI